MSGCLNYVGQVRSIASWAKVNRELCLALWRLGVDVRIKELREDRYEEGFPLTAPFPSLLETSPAFPADGPLITFSSPSQYPKILGRPPTVGILVYEADIWPPSWVDLAAHHLSRVVVPCGYAKETLAASGFPGGQIGVVPHGIDPTVYHSAGRLSVGDRDVLRLLFVGTAARRKGLDLLLQALRRTSLTESVELVVKIASYSDAFARPYLDSGYAVNLERLKHLGYRVKLINRYMTEKDMASLYRSVDLLCLPFRGECYPLPVLEAMACGTPVLATDWSGPKDVLDEDVGFLLQPSKRIRAEDLLAESAIAHPSAQMVEPDVDEIVARLNEAVQDRPALSVRGVAASARAAVLTWESAARQLLKELSIVRDGNIPEPTAPQC